MQDSASDLTLRQLQIFWSVVHAGSLTRAAKQLEMRQPSISQQLSKMEHVVGGKLIRFVNNEMRLTPAGEFLLAEAGRILGAVDRTKAGLAEFFEGRRGRLVVGTLPSLARNLLMPAFRQLVEGDRVYFLDIVEMTPREAIEQLQGRMIDMALISGYAAMTRHNPGLKAIVMAEDRQLLAVPLSLPDLAGMATPESELEPAHRDVLNRTIRYAFGSEHSNRVNMWYDQLLPQAVTVARCRSYESALSFVELGLGSALVPEFALQQDGRQLFDVTIYKVPVPVRQTIALMPNHYVTLPGFQRVLDALRDAFAAMPRLEARPVPAFARQRLASADADAPAQPQ